MGPEEKPNRNTKPPSCGPYLVRSGNIFLFQMKVPKRIGGRSERRPLRISLGVLPSNEARRLAGILAGLAIGWFREIEGRMRMSENMDDLRSGDDAEADDGDLLWSFLTTQMKAALYDIRNPVPEISPEDKRRFEGWRDLISISREVVAKREGHPHSSLIADNATMLAASAAKKLDPTTDLPTPPAPTLVVTQFTPGDAFPARQVDVPKSPTPPAIGSTQPDSDTPAAQRDRRFVARPSSDQPLFSQVARDYFAQREANTSLGNKDIGTARFRIALFIELIGDHPVDTYSVTDLQAYVNLLKYWPAKLKERPEVESIRQVLKDNADHHLEPLAIKTLRDGYVTGVKSVVAYGERHLGFKNQIRGARIDYPETAKPTVPSEPLASHKISQLLLTAVETGELDYTMLPLLGLLTGRRLALLVYLRGNDIREKYKGVWVAQTPGIILVGKVWKRVPYKTDASITYFVLHQFLVEIGFVEWAASLGDRFIFQELTRLVDPSKSASQYMGRLFERAEIKDTRSEVFHSLRGGYIDESRDQDVSARDSKLQVGHEVGADEHDLYGFRALSEKTARRLATLELNPEIDLSVYRGLDFKNIDGKKRSSGRKSRKN
jgi:integrase